MDRPPRETVPPPASVITAGGVYLPGAVCEPIWRILRAELHRRRTDGGHLRPDIAQALDALRAAALTHLETMSAAGLPARTHEDLAAPLTRELLTTSDLAARLGCTDRHTRRLAAAEGIKPAARGLWRAEDAAALIAARRARNPR